jgi:L-amino acid N-acyltransferase YncA
MKWSIKKYFNKVIRNLNDYGLMNTFIKSIFVVFGFIFTKRIYRIYRKDLRNLLLEQPSIADGFQYREVKEGDLNYIKEIENIAEWLLGCLKRMLENGAYCITLMENEKIIAFNLINFNNIYMPLINYHKNFNTYSAWSEHIWVIKKYRKSGIATKLRKKIFWELSQRNIKWLYGGSLLSNKASLRLASKLGFKSIININYVRLFGCEKWNFIKLGK